MSAVACGRLGFERNIEGENGFAERDAGDVGPGGDGDGGLLFADADVRALGVWEDHTLDVPTIIRDIDGSSLNNVWAVGNGGNTWRWEGVAWESVPSGTAIQLNAVVVIAESDVWAVGNDGAILHWDGATWDQMVSPVTNDLFALWAISPNDVWAVGTITSAHWDGNSWTTPATAPSAQMSGVWASGPNDVWSVGTNLAGSSRVNHWDGNGWTQIASPGLYNVDAVVGTGAGQMWAFGWDWVDGFALKWNGTDWVDEPIPTVAWLHDGYALSNNDVWATGLEGTVIRWNGQQWSAHVIDPADVFRAVWAHQDGGGTRVWVAGSDGRLLSALW